jgi:HlyD family secretion protein
VRAPVDGFIGTLNVQNRMVVAANAPLMTLVDLSARSRARGARNLCGRHRPGHERRDQRCTGTATGKLSALSPEVVKNQVLARVRFDGEQPKGLRQSQRVTARLLIEEKPNVLMVRAARSSKAKAAASPTWSATASPCAPRSRWAPPASRQSKSSGG